MARTVHGFEQGPILFSPRDLHATERWEGSRAVLVAWTPRDLRRLDPSDMGRLLGLGFKLASPTPPEPLPDVTFSLEFGIRWSPEEFVAQAAKVEHPCHLKQLVPQELRECQPSPGGSCLVSGPDGHCQKVDCLGERADAQGGGVETGHVGKSQECSFQQATDYCC